MNIKTKTYRIMSKAFSKILFKIRNLSLIKVILRTQKLKIILKLKVLTKKMMNSLSILSSIAGSTFLSLQKYNLSHRCQSQFWRILKMKLIKESFLNKKKREEQPLLIESKKWEKTWSEIRVWDVLIVEFPLLLKDQKVPKYKYKDHNHSKDLKQQ